MISPVTLPSIAPAYSHVTTVYPVSAAVQLLAGEVNIQSTTEDTEDAAKIVKWSLSRMTCPNLSCHRNNT